MSGSSAQQVERVRQFNRFYTCQIGVLNEGLLDSPFSLTEVRVLYELAHRTRPTAVEIRAALGLDAGYLSRMLRNFQRRGWIAKAASRDDARKRHLALTKRGRATFAPLDARSHAAVAAMLQRLAPADRDRVVAAMGTIESAFQGPDKAAPGYLLRPHQPGDMGWIVHRHGVLYAQEYAWDERFEALVAEIVAGFIRKFDPRRERCWIAERDGNIVGCVFLVQRSATVAQLRLLLVEPQARGLGIGARLVSECVRFAQRSRYRKIVLWTNSILHAARTLYERAGFRLIAEQAHTGFGPDLVAQTWELKLGDSPGARQ